MKTTMESTTEPKIGTATHISRMKMTMRTSTTSTHAIGNSMILSKMEQLTYTMVDTITIVTVIGATT